jgi:ketosteroid isomerase-like protein
MQRMNPNELDKVANELFAAVAAGDTDRVRAIYADDVEVWHNATQKTQTIDENLRLLKSFTSRVSDLRYEVHEREFFSGGFVQRHTLHGKLASGDPLDVPVCIVIHAADGKIQRIFEYIDSAAVAPAFAR